MSSNGVVANSQSIGRYWILTIPYDDWSNLGLTSFELSSSSWHLVAIKGQVEVGASGYKHWQLVVRYDRSVRFGHVKKNFPSSAHIELCRSSAANAYVHKEETAVPGTRFSYGEMEPRRGPKRESVDWQNIYGLAKSGDFEKIPPAIYIRHKASLNSVYVDHIQVQDRDVEIICYYGNAGTGKSLRAKYETLGMSVFKKDPTSKWWDGYKGEEAVIVDEYYGDWPLSNFLIWCDRYGSRGEIKGGSCPLLFKKMIFTSNVSPSEWYPKTTIHQKAAIARRISPFEMATACWMELYYLNLVNAGLLPRRSQYSDSVLRDDPSDITVAESDAVLASVQTSSVPDTISTELTPSVTDRTDRIILDSSPCMSPRSLAFLHDMNEKRGIHGYPAIPVRECPIPPGFIVE